LKDSKSLRVLTIIDYTPQLLFTELQGEALISRILELNPPNVGVNFCISKPAAEHTLLLTAFDLNSPELLVAAFQAGFDPSLALHLHYRTSPTHYSYLHLLALDNLTQFQYDLSQTQNSPILMNSITSQNFRL